VRQDNRSLFQSQLGDVIAKYSLLKVTEDDLGDTFLTGVIDIPNDNGEIVDNFLIEIHRSNGFPYRFPILFEIGERIPNDPAWHKYPRDWSCCITVTPAEVLACKNGISILLFIEKHAIPYFANFIHRKLTGKYKNGEYAHNPKAGYSQFYEELLKTGDKDLWAQYFCYAFKNLKTTCGRNDPCFCGSGTKYKNCHEKIFHTLKFLGEEQVFNDFKQIGK
jgi:hypothetical protein